MVSGRSSRICPKSDLSNVWYLLSQTYAMPAEAVGSGTARTRARDRASAIGRVCGESPSRSVKLFAWPAALEQASSIDTPHATVARRAPALAPGNLS